MCENTNDLRRSPRDGRGPNPARSRGITLIELLIVMAIVGIVATLGVFAGRRILLGQEQRAAITSIQQIVWQGATAAAARGLSTTLTLIGGDFVLESDEGHVLRRFELPSGVTSNWPPDQALVFTPPGKVDVDSLDALPDDLVVTADGSTTALTISLIGEVRAVKR